MPSTARTFKQADLERAMRAARACDLPIIRSEVTKDGRIVLVHFDRCDAQTVATNDDAAPSEWDEYFNAQGKE